MATEVHSNMQLPRYCSVKNINDNVGWPLRHEDQSLGQYSDILFTRMAVGYDKEQMRQTILKQDSIFRHQLHELHRLYRIQRDMMNKMNSEEGNKHLIPVTEAQSNPFSSGFMSDNEHKRWHGSESHLSDLNGFRLSVSDAHRIQSHFKGKISETLESQSNRVRTGSKLFDLERPAEEYINKEDCRGLISARKQDEILSLHNDSNYTSFNLNLKRRICAVTDLNEPVLVEEPSTSACFGIDNITGLKEEEVVKRKDLSLLSREPDEARERGVRLINLHERRENVWFSNKFENGQTRSNGSFHSEDLLASCKPVPAETSKADEARERGVRLINLHERRQNGWFPNKFENGQTRSNGSLHSENLLASCKLVQAETSKANAAIFLLPDKDKRETCTKRKIFGVEIPEKCNGISTSAVSHALDPLLVCSQSDAANTDIVSSSTSTKFSGESGQNRLGNPGSRTNGQLNISMPALFQGHDFIRGKLIVDSNSRSLPSLKAEASLQNDLLFGFPSDFKKSDVHCRSINFFNENSISGSMFASQQYSQYGPKFSFQLKESKSAIDLNMAVDGCRYEEICRSNFPSINGSIEQKSCAELSWLRASRPCNAKPIKEEGCCPMNLDSLQNCSEHSVEKTANKIQHSLSGTCADSDCSSSSTKILEFSVGENASKDPRSPNSPLKPGSPSSAIGSVNIVMTHVPLPPQCVKKDLVSERKPVQQNAGVRHIDLNLCVIEEGVEEDVQSSPASMRVDMRIANIDLEIPAIEMETKVTSGLECLETNITKRHKLFHDGISESESNGLVLSVSAAAEALVAISSSCLTNLKENATCQQSKTSLRDSLLWFAEIVSRCQSDCENDGASASGACIEDSTLDGIDIFELMTLNLTETRMEYCYKRQVVENKNAEVPVPKRARRGQARRGRQRKDFQRDVLPNLTSLSRNEMTKDFEMIEGLIRAGGGNWQSSLTQKNHVRGRKRAGGSAPLATIEDCCKQVKEGSLTGWGKRTRRPPRQRCPISSPLTMK